MKQTLIFLFLLICINTYSQQYNARYIMLSSKVDTTWTEWSGIIEYNVLLEKKYNTFTLYTPNIQSYFIKDKLEPKIIDDFIKQIYIAHDSKQIPCLLVMLIRLDGSKFFEIIYDNEAYLITLD